MEVSGSETKMMELVKIGEEREDRELYKPAVLRIHSNLFTSALSKCGGRALVAVRAVDGGLKEA